MKYKEEIQEVVKKGKKKLKTKIVIFSIVGVVGVTGVVAFSCYKKVPAGYVGVVYAPSNGVQDQELLTQGRRFLAPWKSVTIFPVSTEQLYMSADEREGSKENDSIDVRTADGKMNADFEMSYSFDSDIISELFTRYRGMSGEEVMNNIVRGKIKTYINEVTSTYTTMDAHMSKKAQLNADILAHLQNKLKEFGIIVESANLTQTRVDESIEAAITERSKAAQELEAERQKAEKAKLEADRKKVEAEGEAEVKRIQAEAEAEANRLLQQTLTDNMISQQWIEKWDGKLPTISGTDSTVVVPKGQ